jgi:hypothetical protein
VVIKYVDNPRRHPVHLLEQVLKPSPIATPGHPFAELDALYRVVLSPVDIDIPLMKRLLHVILEITRLAGPSDGDRESSLDSLTQEILSASTLDEFLSLEEGTTEMTLCDLHSILSTEDAKRPWIYFHHKSLEDYLSSPQRAGNLYQSQEDTHSDILTACIHNTKFWNQVLSSPGFQEGNITLEFSCQVWQQLLIVKQCFPPSVLDFDTRIAWRCFTFGQTSLPAKFIFKDFVDSFHNIMVSWTDLALLSPRSRPPIT